jgi:hypothetical protein
MQKAIISIKDASVPSAQLQTEITSLIDEINQFLLNHWAYVSLEFDPQVRFKYNTEQSDNMVYYSKAAVDHVVHIMNTGAEWTAILTKENSITIYDQKKHKEAVERNSSGGR